MRHLWTEQYRPKSIEDYVFRDANQKHQIQSWLQDGALPHLLFTGGPGTGKTTLAKVFFSELGVEDLDVLEINASNENNVDTIRNKITNFAGTMPFGDMKYILLDEGDYLTVNSQAALRGVMEKYHHSCRFVITANYPNRIIPAIHSRCQGFHIEKLDVTEFTARIAQICIAEDVEIDLDVLDIYVQSTYPDLRKCINLVQQNVVEGVLRTPHKSDEGQSDWMVEAVAHFKLGKFREGRNTIVNNAKPEEYDDIYRFLYRNLHYWGETDAEKDNALLVIRDGLVKSVSCADPEINLSATITELMLIKS